MHCWDLFELENRLSSDTAADTLVALDNLIGAARGNVEGAVLTARDALARAVLDAALLNAARAALLDAADTVSAAACGCVE